MKIDLSRIHYPVTTLGYGSRLGIWFQGCSIRCEGCISVDTWAKGAHSIDTAAIAESSKEWLGTADGITISGGEPFDQAEALKDLLFKLRPLCSGDILVYTGYSYAQIANQLAALDGLVDVLITEPFIENESQNLPLRGSDNQQLITLSDLGRTRYSTTNLNAYQKNLDLMFDEDTNTIWLAGIPQRGDLHRVGELMSSFGLQVATSEDRRTFDV